MTNRAHEAYLNEKILSADPVELVRLLFAGLSEAVEAARTRLAARDIRGRSKAVTKAVRILAELAGALDHSHAPELSAKLAALYDYMQRRLLDANFRQVDAPLAEVQDLVRTLAEAWQEVPAAPATPAAPVPAAAAPAASWPVWNPAAASGEPSLHGWSF